MGTIICQNCDSTIDYFEDEKVTVLYAASHKCTNCDTATDNENK